MVKASCKAYKASLRCKGIATESGKSLFLSASMVLDTEVTAAPPFPEALER